MSEPTAGALRAAEAIADNEREHFSAVIQIYAEIIDRETGLPELLGALEAAVRALHQLTSCERSDCRITSHSVADSYCQRCAAILRAGGAVARARGEQ